MAPCLASSTLILPHSSLFVSLHLLRRAVKSKAPPLVQGSLFLRPPFFYHENSSFCKNMQVGRLHIRAHLPHSNNGCSHNHVDENHIHSLESHNDEEKHEKGRHPHSHCHCHAGKCDASHNAAQKMILTVAAALGLTKLADALRDNFRLCCLSMAMLLLAALCPYLANQRVGSSLQNGLAYSAFPLVGVPAILDAAVDMAGLKVNIHVLMALAAFASLVMGNALEGGLLLAMFSFSHIAEEYFTERALRDVNALKESNPESALVLETNGNSAAPSMSAMTYSEVPLKEVRVGSFILVRAGEAVPVDGEVWQGRSMVTVEHLTGESEPIEKKVGDLVPGGARNLDGMLIIKGTKTWEDSTLARIMKLTEEAQQNRPKLQRWLDEFGERYSQAVIAVSVSVALFGPVIFKWPLISNSVCRGSVYRALGLMVAASPCALAAAPLAYATAVSSCASKGILLKGGHALDALANCDTVAFDKTGTLTTGDLICKAIEPIYGHVTGVWEEPKIDRCCNPNCEAEALAVAAAMEQGASHPIARLIAVFLVLLCDHGCPLAPYLFLFFAKTMVLYLRGRTPQIQGLHMPIDGSPDLVEQEYVDDTMIFCQYDSNTLDRLQSTLFVICCASVSLINWHKSSGFVVGVDDVCAWGEHQGFTWVAPGQTCRYLGFHVGLEVSSRQQFEPVLASIRRKLCNWASMHLSLAGRALVVNQVLLARVWFTTSCWTLYSRALSRLRCLVRNFLWGGSDGTRDTRPQVSWRTVILPRQEGGLGIIDPEMQSAALLSKLIVRGLYPGEEPWKQFMLHGLSRCVPSSGCMDAAGPWRPSIRYIFTTQSRLSTQHLSPFMYSIFRVWLTTCRGLIWHAPSCQEEIERQPLVWNDYVKDEHGRELRERTHIDLGQMGVRAVVDHSEGKLLPTLAIENFEAFPGKGLEATISGLESQNGGKHRALLGSLDYVASSMKLVSGTGKIINAAKSSAYGNELVRAALSVNEKVTLFHFEDKLRHGAPDVIASLKKAGMQILMLTGDHGSSANRVAKAVGIEEVHHGMKPEDKLHCIKRLSRQSGKGLSRGLIMVGDGVNDAPALAAATVGVVLAHYASATAIAVADVLLLQDNIDGVPFVIAKAHQTTTLVKQSVGLALSCILAASLPSVMGFLPLWLTVLLHEGGTLLVCLNSVRALNDPRDNWNWQHNVKKLTDALAALNHLFHRDHLSQRIQSAGSLS
ncbi:hypothetical protein L7F22_045048 [Adiantum nelumboides]|nr:hypothetical protein [Adiantum nelumboides]